ncbi:hypothetical protein A3J41_01680 [candidate division TM6 bacterium RIFCSPHIGHO2_12_FULL_38_8]|nr:MAG: hypothetical protein A3J41_01680 [candidate division TM6 bacterium RIFCSPHIGHO2_12_FULL_38_8]
MKSVIAQGSTIAKAIEEALKKAGMPAEFFVKLLEDAQGGFLGFGAKKAKIALFFKQNHPNFKHDELLSQETYQDLFNSQAIGRQIEQQLKDVGTSKNQAPIHQPKPQQPQKQPHSMQQQRPQQRPMQRRELSTAQSNSQSRPMTQQPSKQIQPKSNPQAQPKQHVEQKNRQNQPSQPSSPSKLMVRPLPNKNNDSSKS